MNDRRLHDGPSSRDGSGKAPSSRLAGTFARLSRFPLGRWLFGRIVCFKAPYFATIAPRFEALEHGRCEISMRDRRRVHNHIGTVHAVALCNLAELAGGVMTEASLPTTMRWIPRAMSVEYCRKAVGTMHATARPGRPPVQSVESYELPVTVDVRDTGGETVFRARITMWVSPRRGE